jgi:hypothetical protein
VILGVEMIYIWEFLFSFLDVRYGVGEPSIEFGCSFADVLKFAFGARDEVNNPGGFTTDLGSYRERFPGDGTGEFGRFYNVRAY